MDQALDPARARAHVLAASDGAICLFEGVVRDHDGGEGVTRLDYSSHPDAEHTLAGIVAAIEAEFEVTAFAEHRIGQLAIGDSALVAACSSAHRQQAFAACQEMVERIKSGVPIWKNQHFTDGRSGWVGLDDA